jgi:hypothetical protein
MYAGGWHGAPLRRGFGLLIAVGSYYPRNVPESTELGVLNADDLQ